MIIYYRIIFKESLDRVDKRLDKISVVLYDLRPRYIIFNLLARISINLITIIISSYCDSYLVNYSIINRR